MKCNESKRNTIPARFEPQFWAEADGRCSVVKEIRRRYESLKQDTCADNCQQDMLCQRATFIAVQLETMERVAVENGPFDAGVYAQMCNALLGLLRTLGLESKPKKVITLSEYMEERQ